MQMHMRLPPLQAEMVRRELDKNIKWGGFMYIIKWSYGATYTLPGDS